MGFFLTILVKNIQEAGDIKDERGKGKKNPWAQERVQQSRVFASLAEDESLVPSTLSRLFTTSSHSSSISSDLRDTQTQTDK